MAKSNKVLLDLQLDLLDNLIGYLFTESPHITRKSLMNIRDLINLVDMRMYENDEAMMARFYFIDQVLKLKLDDGLFNYNLILEQIKGGSHDEEIEYIIDTLNESGELLPEEVKAVNKYISERLKNIHLFVYKDEIINAFEQLQIGDYESISDINDKVERSCGNLLADLRKAKADDMSNNDFDLTDDSFSTVVEAVVEDLSRPSNYVKTGLQYLNEMYVGGYEAGRVYMYLGPSGGGKSVILLHSAIWGRNFNSDNITLKDPSKQPCIIFLSMENSIKETVERIFNMYFNDDIRKYDPKVVTRMLQEKAGFSLDVNGINLKIMYRPNKSISTDDLYTIIDEYEEEGYETIMLVLDYVKRIRPAQMTKDVRLDLGNIVDELTVLAKLRNIPVVSATQMNREAIKVIEEASQSGATDIAKKLGSSHVGESWTMVENVDYLTAIFKEYKQSTDTWYMTFKSLKTRAKNPSISYFAHPFEKDNQIHLLEDIDLKEPLSVKTLGEQLSSQAISNVGLRGRTTVNRKGAGVSSKDQIRSLRSAAPTDDDDTEGL